LTYPQSMITTITEENQVTLPAEIVRALNLTPGTQLDWTIGPDHTLDRYAGTQSRETCCGTHGRWTQISAPRLRPRTRSDRRTGAGIPAGKVTRTIPTPLDRNALKSPLLSNLYASLSEEFKVFRQ
jgi:hypothetical protein